MDELDVTTVEEVNNSLHVKYKQQKRLINNLLLVVVFWLLMFLLGTLLTVGTPEVLDKVIFFGGLSVIPILLVLLKQFSNINKINKNIKDLNLQKEIFTEQILEKEKHSFKNRMKVDEDLLSK